MKDINDKSNKVYLVLGMHKSGTSFIAKALKEQGVKMTSLDNASFLRHFEDEQMLNLNKEILGETDEDEWWRTPPREEINKKDFKEKITSILRSVKTQFWGFKDPRTILTIDHFLPHFKDDDVYLICMFRKPKKVQESLVRVKGEKDWSGVIDEYNKRLIEVIERFTGL